MRSPTLLTVLIVCNLTAQTRTDDYRIARLYQLDSLDKKTYSIVQPFNFIIVGEMHGTKEPAAFVLALTRKFVEMGDSVEIGLEIRKNELQGFSENADSRNLINSTFFSTTERNPQASQAWLDLLSTASKLKGVKLFYFDVIYNPENISYPRDSAMYLNIKREFLKKASSRIILLTGSTHASLSKVNNIPTLAYYISTDHEISSSASILSVSHHCHIGEYWDTSGNLPVQYEKIYEKPELVDKLHLNSFIILSADAINSSRRLVLYTDKATRSPLTWLKPQ